MTWTVGSSGWRTAGRSCRCSTWRMEIRTGTVKIIAYFLEKFLVGFFKKKYTLLFFNYFNEILNASLTSAIKFFGKTLFSKLKEHSQKPEKTFSKFCFTHCCAKTPICTFLRCVVSLIAFLACSPQPVRVTMRPWYTSGSGEGDSGRLHGAGYLTINSQDKSIKEIEVLKNLNVLL